MARLPAVTAAVGIFLLALSTFAYAAEVNPCPYSWKQNLKQGGVGPDVLALQRFLNEDPVTQIALSGSGSPGNESTSFGGKTKAAVIKFQEKYAADILAPNGLSSGTGVIGASTRAELNALCTSPVSGTPPATSGQVAAAAVGVSADNLTLSDPGQPTSSLVPANAGVLFLSFTLTAGEKDVTVSGVAVQRSGAGSDAPFSSLGLYGEDGLQIGNIVSLDSDHRAAFKQPFTVPAHTSLQFDVYVNTSADLSGSDGQTPHLELTGITASSPLVGTLPLVGSPQTVNSSLVVGTGLLTLSAFDPNTPTTHYINDTNVRFSGIRITADSTEDLALSNIIWEQTGTAGSNDIANVVTVVNGTPVPTTVRGREYISFFDPAMVIRKGESADIYIQGDLTSTGSNRTVEFDIHDNTDDISLAGNTYGFAVGAIPNGNTATGGHSVFLTDTGDTSGNSLTPFFSGSVVTISPGAMISVSR